MEKYTTFGLDVLLTFILRRDEMLWNPHDNLFPTMANCEFDKGIEFGNVQTYKSFKCTLSINELNQKVFLTLWFWFPFLIICCPEKPSSAWLLAYQFCNEKRLPTIHPNLFLKVSSKLMPKTLHTLSSNTVYNQSQRITLFQLLYFMIINDSLISIVLFGILTIKFHKRSVHWLVPWLIFLLVSSVAWGWLRMEIRGSNDRSR